MASGFTSTSLRKASYSAIGHGDEIGLYFSSLYPPIYTSLQSSVSSLTSFLKEKVFDCSFTASPTPTLSSVKMTERHSGLALDFHLHVALNKANCKRIGSFDEALSHRLLRHDAGSKQAGLLGRE